MEKVAILIPTKNRVDFLIRTIEYYVSINSSHPIFIGDASSNSSKKLVLKAAQNQIEVYYFHWENLNDRKTLIKLAQKASQINITDYCAYHGDDDFFVSESLSKCAEFLSKNPSYATAQGRAIRLDLNEDGPYGKMKDIGIYWNLNELKGDTALERLEEISANYWVPIFSVHRIKEYVDDMSNGIDSVIDRDFGEYANSLTIAMRGKSKFIDCLFLARHIHSGIDHPRQLEWITGNNWYSSYNELITSLSTVLSENDNLNIAESYKVVKEAIDKRILINRNYDMSIYDYVKQKYSVYIGKKGFLNVLIRLFRQIRYFPLLPSKDFSKRGLRSKRSKYYKDILPILNACKKH